MFKKIITILPLLLASQAIFANCETTVNSDDDMNFDVKEIIVPASCTEFTVNLNHTGILDKKAMGHNVVISKLDDLDAVATAGKEAGLANDYVKPGDTRVIAYTKLIGGGEKTSVTFAVAKIKNKDDFVFFCSYPGHPKSMKGIIKVK